MMQRRDRFRPIGRAISGACLLAAALSCAGGSTEEAQPGSFREASELPLFLPHRASLDLRAAGVILHYIPEYSEPKTHRSASVRPGIRVMRRFHRYLGYIPIEMMPDMAPI